MTIVKPRIENKTHMDNTQSTDKDNNDNDDVPLTYLETIHFNKYMVSSEQDTLVGLQYVNSRDWDDDDDDLSTTDVDDDDLSSTDVDDDDDDETNLQHRNLNDDEGKEDCKLLDDTTSATQPSESTIIMEMNTPTNIPSTTLPSTNHEEEGVVRLPTLVANRSQSSSSSTPCWNEPHVLPTKEEEKEKNIQRCQFPNQQSKLMGMEFHILWSSLQGLSFS